MILRLLILAFLIRLRTASLMPGYGVNFEPKGQIHLDLKRWDIFAGIELPTPDDKIVPPSEFIASDLCTGAMNGNKLLEETCFNVRPLVEHFQRVDQAQVREINRKRLFEIPALLPSLQDLNDISKINEDGDSFIGVSLDGDPGNQAPAEKLREDPMYQEVFDELKQAATSLIDEEKQREKQREQEILAKVTPPPPTPKRNRGRKRREARSQHTIAELIPSPSKPPRPTVHEDLRE